MRLGDLAAADCAEAAALMRESYADAFGPSMAPTDLDGVLSNLTEARFRAALASSRLIGAWVDSTLVGFVQIGPAPESLRRAANLDDEAEAMELSRLYVRPGHQGRGIGRALMQGALRHAGAQPIVLDVWIRNARALALYRSHGFTVVGEIYPDFASGTAPEPDLVMLRPGTA